MATVPVQTPGVAGVADIAYTAATGVTGTATDQFKNTGKELLLIKNANGAAVRTVTIDSVTPSNYGTDVNVVVVVPTTSEAIVGPLPKARFDDTNGFVKFSVDTIADTSYAVIRGR